MGESLRLLRVLVQVEAAADDGTNLRAIPPATMTLDAADVDRIPQLIRDGLAELEAAGIPPKPPAPPNRAARRAAGRKGPTPKRAAPAPDAAGT